MVDFSQKFCPDRLLCHHKCYEFTTASGFIGTERPILFSIITANFYSCVTSCATSGTDKIFRRPDEKCYVTCDSGFYEARDESTFTTLTSADAAGFTSTDPKNDYFCLVNKAACTKAYMRWDKTHSLWRCTSIKDTDDFILYSTKDDSLKYISKACDNST
jgi:hypothetical protein